MSSADTHFVGYRSLYIQGSVHWTKRIQDILKKIDTDKTSKEDAKTLARDAISILDTGGSTCTCNRCCEVRAYS